MADVAIVISDRMGKGHKVAAGIDSVEGCRAIVVPQLSLAHCWDRCYFMLGKTDYWWCYFRCNGIWWIVSNNLIDDYKIILFIMLYK
ncbi:hypothetical protein DES39_1562 [Orbus hercynius]|uniref:Uncharacterized protein n=1 Tax=Orbus hercynius TaxID=593135 RepID=A0A495RC60_9GAMM|nr:hypothetical protein DES39_1562 [Orbus hercynius]